MFDVKEYINDLRSSWKTELDERIEHSKQLAEHDIEIIMDNVEKQEFINQMNKKNAILRIKIEALDKIATSFKIKVEEELKQAIGGDELLKEWKRKAKTYKNKNIQENIEWAIDNIKNNNILKEILEKYIEDINTSSNKTKKEVEEIKKLLLLPVYDNLSFTDSIKYTTLNAIVNTTSLAMEDVKEMLNTTYTNQLDLLKKYYYCHDLFKQNLEKAIDKIKKIEGKKDLNLKGIFKKLFIDPKTEKVLLQEVLLQEKLLQEVLLQEKLLQEELLQEKLLQEELLQEKLLQEELLQEEKNILQENNDVESSIDIDKEGDKSYDVEEKMEEGEGIEKNSTTSNTENKEEGYIFVEQSNSPSVEGNDESQYKKPSASNLDTSEQKAFDAKTKKDNDKSYDVEEKMEEGEGIEKNSTTSNTENKEEGYIFVEQSNSPSVEGNDESQYKKPSVSNLDTSEQKAFDAKTKKDNDKSYDVEEKMEEGEGIEKNSTTSNTENKEDDVYRDDAYIDKEGDEFYDLEEDDAYIDKEGDEFYDLEEDDAYIDKEGDEFYDLEEDDAYIDKEGDEFYDLEEKIEEGERIEGDLFYDADSNLDTPEQKAFDAKTKKDNDKSYDVEEKMEEGEGIEKNSTTSNTENKEEGYIFVEQSNSPSVEGNDESQYKKPYFFSIGRILLFIYLFANLCRKMTTNKNKSPSTKNFKANECDKQGKASLHQI